MSTDLKIDAYIDGLPDWQRVVCSAVREWVHEADPGISEEIKFTNRPYFTDKGNVAALLATKDHINVFIYDPIAPDPESLINQGLGNATARSIQIFKGQNINKAAFIKLIQAVVKNNHAGGWRKLK